MNCERRDDLGNGCVEFLTERRVLRRHVDKRNRTCFDSLVKLPFMGLYLSTGSHVSTLERQTAPTASRTTLPSDDGTVISSS